MQQGERFIILLRHGIAEDHGADKPEEQRELTDEGHRKMKKIGRGLAELFPKAETIVTSPLRRAVQTAEWVVHAYDSIPLETSPALAPDSDEVRFRELLGGVSTQRAIFVGHEPLLSTFMLTLTGMTGQIELKKGGCYGVRIDANGAGHLEWMLPPRAMKW
jgi:phosphohistidine phosphatase